MFTGAHLEWRCDLIGAFHVHLLLTWLIHCNWRSFLYHPSSVMLNYWTFIISVAGAASFGKPSDDSTGDICRFRSVSLFWTELCTVTRSKMFPQKGKNPPRMHILYRNLNRSKVFYPCWKYVHFLLFTFGASILHLNWHVLTWHLLFLESFQCVQLLIKLPPVHMN